jgi:hypothetical protein
MPTNPMPLAAETVPPRRPSRWLRRAAFIIATVFTVVAVFYVVENRRGRKAWERCQQELRARGEQLDWAAYLPARVPEGQNFIKNPLLEAVAYRGQVDTNVWEALQEAGHSLIWEAWVDSQSGRKMDWGRVSAEQLLQDLRKVEPQLDELRVASLKPFAQFDIDRTSPFEESPEINFVAMRTLSQILAFHACAELVSDHPEKAFADVRVIHRLSDGLKDENTLVAFFIRVALERLALEPFWQGWAEGRWSERELASFQERFGRIDLLPEFTRVMHAERAGVNGLVEKYGIQRNEFGRVTMRSEPARKGWSGAVRREMEKLAWKLIPRGWIYQNLVSYDQRIQALIPPSLRSKPPTVSPTQVNEIKGRLPREIPNGPYGWLSGMAIPNFSRGLEKVAQIQTSVNQATIVCALERFRLTRGEYPTSLTELTPQFINQLPLDVIDGRPMKYRRTNDGKFVLYSVGWNEKDDGGTVSPTTDKGKRNATEGDWVWQFPLGK